MRISTKGRYALRLMLDLAREDSSAPVSLLKIAERQNISVKYLERIAGLLQKAGFIGASRGASGGYQLLVLPKDLKIGAILSATEGSLKPVACAEKTASGCVGCDTCATQRFFMGLDRVVDEYLYKTSLQDLLDSPCDNG